MPLEIVEKDEAFSLSAMLPTSAFMLVLKKIRFARRNGLHFTKFLFPQVKCSILTKLTASIWSSIFYFGRCHI